MPRLSPEQYKQAMFMIGIRPRGSRFRNQDLVKCVFHKDSNPSMSVNFSKGVYHCFVCGAKGSMRGLVKNKRGVTIERLLGIEKDITEVIGGRVAEPEPEIEEPEPVDPHKFDTPIDIRGVPVPFDRSPEAQEYLRKRDIPEDIARDLEVQYMEEGYINGTHFCKRLLIPVYNEHGTLVNMEGRDVTFEQKPKCLYPANALKPLFQFSRLDLTKPVFMFEGIIKTAVARTDPFFKNSTAGLGADLSDYQVEMLNRIPHLIIVPDNDTAGGNVVKTYKKIYHGILEVYRIADPSIKDADEIPKKSGKSVKDFRESGGFFYEVNYDLGD